MSYKLGEVIWNDDGTMATDKLTPLRALWYLDDIAHGRKMSLDAHELELVVEKEIKALEIIKSINFSLEFDKSQYEWFLYISNEKQCVLVAKGTGKKTYELLKEVLL